MIQDYSMGGCKMIEIFSFIKSLKVSWFRRILRNTGDCASLLTYTSTCDTEILCKAGDKYPLLCLQKTKNLNWKESLRVLHEFYTKSQAKSSLNSIPILYNSSSFALTKNQFV